MTAITPTAGLQVRRTAWDVILGILILIAAFVLLGDAVFATAVSVLLLAWTTLVAGVLLFVGAFFRMRSGGFWSAALGGAVLVVLGLFILRNPLVGAFTLTLMAGALFFASGLTRVISAGQHKDGRALLIVSGIISMGLGTWVLLNMMTATMTLLGVLLGVQTLIEGLTLIFFGRLRPPRTA